MPDRKRKNGKKINESVAKMLSETSKRLEEKINHIKEQKKVA